MNKARLGIYIKDVEFHR